jgi:hypothetical protein
LRSQALHVVLSDVKGTVSPEARKTGVLAASTDIDYFLQ